MTKPHIHLAQFLCPGPTYHSLHQPPAPVLHGFAFRPAGAQPGAEPYDLAEGVNVPVLVLHGTEDERAPIADMRRMEARMRELGKACTFSSTTALATASPQAWRTILTFSPPIASGHTTTAPGLAVCFKPP